MVKSRNLEIKLKIHDYGLCSAALSFCSDPFSVFCSTSGFSSSAVLVTDMAESRANAAKQASQKGNPEDAREAAEEYKKNQSSG